MGTLLAVEDPVTAAGLRTLLDPDPDIGLVDSPAEAAVAVLAVPAIDEAAMLQMKELHREHGLALLVVVDEVDEQALVTAVEHGANGLVLRADATGQRLRTAVHASARGEGSMTPKLLGRLLHAVEQGGLGDIAGRSASRDGLTSREREVVRLLAAGYDTQQIAGALSYSPRTIKNVVHDCIVRLNLRNRTHLVAHAIRRELL